MLDFLALSDFNVQNLVAILNNLGSRSGLRACASSYDQVMQTLLSSDGDTWGTRNAAIVWTSPHGISSASRSAVGGEPIDADKLSEEVANFARALCGVPAQIEHLFVPSWIPLHPWEDRRGLLDMNAGYGIAAALARMNSELRLAVDAQRRIHLFNAQRWMAAVGENAYSPKLWYLSKTPFTVNLFREAAGDFAAPARGLTGNARKLLIVDLGNTLWGGIVGESGWRGLILGGHDAVGEAFRDFQLVLRSLRRRGVLLGIVSKNEETVALGAIREHPEMVLRPDDFAGWKINGNDKAQNVLDLIADLNLGVDAAVFIDDDPVERARVREAVPQVLVLEWPESPLEFPSALRRLNCFDVGIISAEDRGRTSTYVAERRRKQERRALRHWMNG